MRVRFLTCHLPLPGISGGRLREFELLRRLAPRHDVHVVAVSKTYDDDLAGVCAVAEGAFDAFVDADVDAHGPWDHLGGLLVCVEAGAAVAERLGRPLLTSAWTARGSPLVAATPELLAELEAAVAVATDDWVATAAAP